MKKLSKISNGVKKDVRPYLKDILESIEKIEEYTESIKEKNFYQNIQIQDAVIRRLEIIGEATKNFKNIKKMQMIYD